MINDEDGVKSIKAFVRNNPDIEVYEYVKRGWNGEVYFGRRKKMGDEVVLKFYESQSDYDASEEAVILKSIKHPNILEIYDLRFLHPHYAYFLTPKIGGGDLQGVIDSQNLPSQCSFKIIAGILLGLTELHSKHRLVHRDLKPGNILIDLPDYNPIIADLGAVKKIADANNSTTASKSTFCYLPPESVLRNEYYFQSDIYQVGLIIFQLLGGFFPVNTPNDWLSDKEKNQIMIIRDSQYRKSKFDEFIASKIKRGTIADLSTLPNFFDDSFKKVLKKALHINPAKRYKNPSHFLKDLHDLMRSYPDYLKESNSIICTHENGKQFKIFADSKGEYFLEKRFGPSKWRRDNSHNGTINSIMSTVNCRYFIY